MRIPLQKLVRRSVAGKFSVSAARTKVKKLFIAFPSQPGEKSPPRMFKLTKHEQCVVAFLVGALVLGITVKHWRELHSPPQSASVQTEGRENNAQTKLH